MRLARGVEISLDVCGHRAGARIGADYNNVLINQRHRVIRHCHVDLALLAEPGSSLPVFALKAISLRPAVKRMRAGLLGFARPMCNARG